MPAKRIVFTDASSITMRDRETLLYEELERSVFVWFDFMPGFFSRGRVVHTSSLQQWTTFPPGSEQNISKAKQDEIVEKIREYWGKGLVELE